MDHICVKTAKVKNLENIATASSILFVEFGKFTKLAESVQAYTDETNDKNFYAMVEDLEGCYRSFMELQVHLEILKDGLLMNKNLVAGEMPGFIEDKSEEKPENEELSNVVSLFKRLTPNDDKK